MPHDEEKDGKRSRWNGLLLLKGVLVLWFTLLVVVGMRGYLMPRKGSVFPAYYHAGKDFLVQKSLYAKQDREKGVDIYRYSPAFAAMVGPFTLVSEPVAGWIWRTIQGGGLLACLYWFSRNGWLLLGDNRTPDFRERAIFLLGCFPLCLTNVNNGQLNCAVTVGMVLAIGLASTGRWGWAGILLAFPVFFKVFPVSLYLLMVLIGPARFSLTFGITLAALFLIPFGMAPKEYIFSQYQEWWSFLGKDDRHYWPVESGYRDLWMVLRVLSIEMPIWVYQIIQVALGGMIALIVLGTRWKKGTTKALEMALVMGTVWMMVCGPTTESSTYTLLAPVLGMLWVRSLNRQQAPLFRGIVWLGLVLLLSGVLAGAFPQTAKIHAWGIQPVGALLLGMGYLLDYFGQIPRWAWGWSWNKRLVEMEAQEWANQSLGTSG